MKRVIDVNGGWFLSSFFFLFDISNSRRQLLTIYTHEFMVLYLFRPLTLSFPRSFCHSVKHTDCQQKIMFYLSIQLLCIKTYDYFFVRHSDISILDNLTETRGKCLLIYRLVLNILWLLLCCCCYVCIFCCATNIQTYFILIERILLLAFVLTISTHTHTSHIYKSI